MNASSRTRTPPNVNEKARISFASGSVRCTLNPPPLFWRDLLQVPLSLPVPCYGLFQWCHLNIHPLWHGRGQLVLAWIPHLAFPPSFSLSPFPPSSSNFSAMLLKHNTLPHTDDRVSQEINNNPLRKYETLLMMKPPLWL